MPIARKEQTLALAALRAPLYAPTVALVFIEQKSRIRYKKRLMQNYICVQSALETYFYERRKRSTPT